MKKKNIMQKTLAIILSFVILATSVPAIVSSAAGGAYDPAPYFDDTAREEGARAWVDEDGNVQVAFPSAKAQPTYLSNKLQKGGEELNIAFYVLELTDLGPKNTVHSSTSLDIIKVPAMKTRAKDNYATFVADPAWNIDLTTNRYNVEITAVDEENWFSESLHTSVTDVPEAQIDVNQVYNFSTSSTAVREIMTFDQNASETATEVLGNALKYTGVVAESGSMSESGTSDTSALRFIMYEKPSGQQSFDTTISRQTWDFSNATEVWFWIDLEGVELDGFSFRLRSNEKGWYDWGNHSRSGDNLASKAGDLMSNTVYSTKGYKGTDGYVHAQQADGTWEKISIVDGGIDLDNFTGYVRVPIEFICSETDTYVTLSNQNFNITDQNIELTKNWNDVVDDTAATNRKNSITLGDTLVDPAGTCIKDALLLQRRIVATETGIGGLGNANYWYYSNGTWTQTENTGDFTSAHVSKIIAAGPEPAQVKDTTDNAYIDANGVVQNRENGYKALDDLYTAGFAFTGCSDESLKEDFYLDNIFFYDENGGPWDENAVTGMPSTTGNPIDDYYDEEMIISNIIFDEIDKYIENPSWANYREVEYIIDFIQQYTVAYAEKGKNATFLDIPEPTISDAEYNAVTTGLKGMATALKRDSFDKFWTAYRECYLEGTLATANSEKNELVPLLVNTLEKMPRASDIESVSNELRIQIIKIWRAYSLLNLGQLKMLGAGEEREIIKLISLLDNFDEGTADEFVVGSQLADLPYIVFNDFEEYEVGDKAYKLENDNNAYTTDVTGGTGDLANDWRHLKGLVTYTTNGNTNITDKDYYGYVTTDGDKSQEALDNKVNYDASHATIDTNGYLNSKAVTTTVESTYTTDAQDGVFHTVTFTRDSTDDASSMVKHNGQSFNTYTEMEALNMSSTGIGALASPTDDDYNDRLSLIFYVDFTEITENFYFTVNLFSKHADGKYEKLRPQMGKAGYNKEWRTYFILDNATGEWVKNVNDDTYCYTATPNEDSDNGVGIPLNGYKGYIKIPVKHFKWYESLISEPRADMDSALLNNIYAIQFAVGGATSTALYGKTYSIDNVGFTYNPDHYPSVNLAHDSYAEIFDAKSNEAYAFEQYVNGDTIYVKEIQLQDSVDADGNPIQVEVEVEVPYQGIDIYDEVTRAERVERAKKMYEALPDYQKGVVMTAYQTLIEYVKIVDGITVLPEPVYTPEQLNELVAALPETVRDAGVSGEDDTGTSLDLIHPGFIQVTDETTGRKVDAVNYDGYKGLTLEMADEIISYYNDSYAYYSESEKASVNGLEFMNAYKAAMRTRQSLENIKSSVDAVAPQVSKLYTPIFDENGSRISSFISIAERDTVGNFYTQQYLPMTYYGKVALAEGKLQSIYQNASRGLTYFLKNTDTYSIDGETIEGGIVTLQKRMQEIYDMAKGHIDNKELFTEDELLRVKYVIEEYNNLLPAYYNVKELYDLEQAILGLFPVINTVAPDNTDIVLTDEKLTGDTSTYTIQYSEILDYHQTGDKYFVRITSANGALVNGNGDSVPYTLTVNGTAKDSNELIAATPFTEDVLNNTYTEASPLNYTITPSLADKPLDLRGMIFDTVTVELVLVENIATKNEDGTVTITPGEPVVVETHQINVEYSAGDTYKVVIPADIPIEWGSTEAKDVSYSVTTEMLATSRINVGVTGNSNELTNPNSADTLTYVANNFKVTEFGNRVTDAKPADLPSVVVSGWDIAPVGEYRTTLTYTVEYLTDQEPDNGTS